jgi:two-component system, NtrC family, nitrogen regulation sensor histidine kinase NtrY
MNEVYKFLDIFSLKLKKQENMIFFFLFITSFFLSLAIFVIISGFFIDTDILDVSSLLILDLLIILLIIFVTFLKVRRIINSRKEGKSGSYLHIQLSAIFGLITLIPSILVTVFSLLFFDQGIKTWFAKKVSTAISGSKFISESYFKEHSNNLKNDIVFLSKEINNEKVAFFTDRDRLTSLLESLVSIKLIDEAIIFERNGQLLAKIGNNFIIDEEPPPPLWSIFRADDGEVSIFTNEKNNRVRGLIKLDRVIPTYLYAGRNVDSLVISRVDSVNEAADQYLNLEKNISKFQNQFNLIFVAINLLVIMLSIWLGLIFANRIINPIKTILNASEKISSGNLKTRIEKFPGFHDFNILRDSLNKMVDKLLEQKNKLFKAKEMINIRRKFTETVIEGVSTGIIYSDTKYDIILFNKRSKEILETEIKTKKVINLFPEIDKVLKDLISKKYRVQQKQLKILISNSQKIINIKISPEIQKNKIVGFIFTFDDVTEFISAQKNAAWANVARYLAHEIRNPLTPIKISAQRIKSNFDKKNFKNEIFENCTSTIIRQVNDIEKLVTEFSNFARMPISKLKSSNIHELIIQKVKSFKMLNPNIMFTFKSKHKKMIIKYDQSQISRVLENLIKNAIESKTKMKMKKIVIETIKNKNMLEIRIEDNGIGFENDVEKLFEPYITHKKGGSGLGLPICKKIIEDHNGDIKLYKSKKLLGGAIKIILPIND